MYNVHRTEVVRSGLLERSVEADVPRIATRTRNTAYAEERAEEASQSNTEKGESEGCVFEAGFNTGATPVP